MQKALIGIKKGMTQVYNEQGEAVPVTVIDMADVFLISRSKGEQGTEIVLGSGQKKHPNKAETSKYKSAGKVPHQIRHFIFSDDSNYGDLKIGDAVLPSVFGVGEIIQATSKTKGKGFQGVMKRWGFKGGQRTHGQTDRERAPGSIGAGTDPGRVWKGKKMPGRMGGKKKTIMNLQVVSVDDEGKVLLVKGAVPGPKGAVVELRESSLKASSNSNTDSGKENKA